MPFDFIKKKIIFPQLLSLLISFSQVYRCKCFSCWLLITQCDFSNHNHPSFGKTYTQIPQNIVDNFKFYLQIDWCDIFNGQRSYVNHKIFRMDSYDLCWPLSDPVLLSWKQSIAALSQMAIEGAPAHCRSITNNNL